MKKLMPFALVALLLTGCPESKDKQSGEVPEGAHDRPPPPNGGAQPGVPPDQGQAARPAQRPEIGTDAPEVAGATSEGDQVSLADYKGKVVLLDFWGTWCGPCVRSLPHTKELVAKYEGRPFTVLGVSFEQGNPEALPKFLEKNPLPWKNISDSSMENVSRWKVLAFPTLYLIDADGKIRHFQEGADPAIDKVIEELVAEAEAKAAS